VGQTNNETCDAVSCMRRSWNKWVDSVGGLRHNIISILYDN